LAFVFKFFTPFTCLFTTSEARREQTKTRSVEPNSPPPKAVGYSVKRGENEVNPFLVLCTEKIERERKRKMLQKKLLANARRFCLQQVFEWEWNDPIFLGEKRMKKPPIKFLYTGYEPMLGGCLRTPIMCCLEDYRTLVWGQRDLVYASYHLSHPMIMYEDKPPAGGAREDEKAQYSNLSLVGGDHPIYDFDTPAGIHWREVRNFFLLQNAPPLAGRFGVKS
jgi:hypothetical protein